MGMSPNMHQQAEAALTSFGLSLPETDASQAWGPTRTLRVKKRIFALFGDKGEGLDALTLRVKLPVAFEMVQDLWFVKESTGWYRTNKWATAYFGPGDDVLVELGTLKDWLLQSYAAMAPKKLGREVLEEHLLGREV